jgi:hypothetical protein
VGIDLKSGSHSQHRIGLETFIGAHHPVGIQAFSLFANIQISSDRVIRDHVGKCWLTVEKGRVREHTFEDILKEFRDFILVAKFFSANQ